MFTPIQWNGIEITLAGTCFYLVLLAIGVGYLVNVLIRKHKITKAIIRKEHALRNLYGERIRCTECPYCKKQLYKPFYHSHTFASFVPTYCKKFRMNLPTGNRILLCQAKDPEKAMRKKQKNSFES